MILNKFKGISTRCLEPSIYLGCYIRPVYFKAYCGIFNAIVGNIIFNTKNFFAFFVYPIFKCLFNAFYILSENFVRMFFIFRIRTPFQIFNSIIGLYTIFVVYTRLFIWVWYERFRYKPMYSFVKRLSFFKKTNYAIAKIYLVRFYTALRGSISFFRWDCFNQSFIRYFVKTFKANNGFPIFIV